MIYTLCTWIENGQEFNHDTQQTLIISFDYIFLIQKIKLRTLYSNNEIL